MIHEEGGGVLGARHHGRRDVARAFPEILELPVPEAARPEPGEEDGNLQDENENREAYHRGSPSPGLETESQNESTGRAEKQSTIGSAAEFVYDDEKHRATYTTNAHVNSDQGDLVAKKIELYMKPGTKELERMEAYEAVTVRLDKRVSSGERMTHFTSEERYVMSGGLVRIVEECRETTGRTLTFFKSTDRIIVDGNLELRTHTTSGGDCPDQRHD
jgi:lipopolysaccharide export system protein LptA